MLRVASTDQTLPGTWHILDRGKPVRKMIDRKSLLPTGKLTLVLVETSMTLRLSAASKLYLVFPLPADVGDQQIFLGGLPTLRTAKGDDLPFQVLFHQGKGASARVAQFEVPECPGEVDIVYTMKWVLLTPPLITRAQRAAVTTALLQKRFGKPRSWDSTPGFPCRTFDQGGPAFVGARAGASPLHTAYNVLRASDELIAYSQDSKFATTDPDVAKANRKGACGPRIRVAEKGLAGVLRGFSVSIFNESPTFTKHALLLLEDPETGNYLLGDVHTGGATLCPHWGDSYILGPYVNEGIPNPHNIKFDYNGPIVYGIYVFSPATVVKDLELTASSHAGFTNAAKCQAWLKKLPGEFSDMQKKLKK